MIRILDIYMMKKFVYILFFVIMAGIVIFLAVDLIENLDKFIRGEVAWKFIAYYYLYFLPYIVYLIFPVTVLLATLFSLGSMAASNEIIAMKASGFSVYRVLIVFAIPALILSFMSLAFGETLVPYFNKQRMDIYRTEVKKIPKTSTSRRGRIYMMDGEHRLVHIKHYNAETLQAYDVSIQVVDANVLYSRVDAKRMQYQKDHWVLSNVIKRDFYGDSVSVQRLGVYEWREMTLKPEDLVKIQAEPEEMNYWELEEFVSKLVSTGADAVRWRVDLKKKLAAPFATFIIVIFGVPIAVVKRRAGLMVGFAISLLVAFLYFGLDKAILVLGYKGLVSPVFSAWGGNALFLAVGIVSAIRVRK